jgi:hypothetical protein
MRVKKIFLEWRSRGSPWSEGQKDLPAVEVERTQEWGSKRSTWSGGQEDHLGVRSNRSTWIGGREFQPGAKNIKIFLG